MHKIILDGKDYSIPSLWDELSARQVRQIAWLSSLKKDGIALSKLFFYILTLSLPFWKRLRLQYYFLFQASIDERGDFLLFVESFRENRRFTTQKLPKVWVRTVLNQIALYGPDSALSNATFYEFIQAEKYFLNYIQTKAPSDKQQWLDRLIATIYRQRRRGYNPALDQDPRIPLNDIGTRYRLSLVSRIDLKTKLAILMYFDGCRQHIIDRFPLVFPKPKQASTPLSLTKQAAHPSQAWLTLISEMAGGMTQYDAIGNTNIYTALTDISYRIKKNQEAQRQQAAQNRKRK